MRYSTDRMLNATGNELCSKILLGESFPARLPFTLLFEQKADTKWNQSEIYSRKTDELKAMGTPALFDLDGHAFWS